MKMPNEMQKLRTMLTEMGIKWQDESTIYPENRIREIMNMFNVSREIADISIYRTHFDAIGCHYSVIYGYGSYGYYDGKLECMVGDEEPEGSMTAEDVLERMEEL